MFDELARVGRQKMEKADGVKCHVAAINSAAKKKLQPGRDPHGT